MKKLILMVFTTLLTITASFAVYSKKVEASMSGIDTASYQCGIGRTAGDFRIVKLTEGTSYTNPCYKSQMSTAPALTGLYHFASNGDWKAEADHFIKVAKPYIGRSVLVLDYEPAHPNPQWAKSWLDYVYQKTGVRPMIYMGLSVENSYNWSAVANSDYALWISQYNNYNSVYGFHPRSLYGSVRHWKSTAIFQYTSSGRLPGWSGNLDFNVFYGNAQSWRAYAMTNGHRPAATKPTPNNVPSASVKPSGAKWVSNNYTYTLKTAVNLRSGASTSARIIATLPAGSVVKTDKAIINGGYRWVRQPRSGGYGYLATGPSTSTTAYVTTKSVATVRKYTVKSGDCLSTIGAKLGISWQTLASKNGLSARSVIYPGQVLHY